MSGGVDELDEPFPFVPFCLGCFGSSGDGLFTKAGEFGLVLHDYSRGRTGFQDVVLELGVEVGLLLVQFLQLVLARIIQQGASAHETGVVPLHEALLDGIQACVGAPIVHRLHALEKRCVQGDGIVMGG